MGSRRTWRRQIRGLRGVGEVYIPQDMNYPALRLDVDRVHAGELGLSQKDVVDNVITALNSNLMIAPNYWVDRKTGNDYFLTVQYFENGAPAIHNSLDLKNIPLRAPNLKPAHDARYRGETHQHPDTHGGGPLPDPEGFRCLCNPQRRGSGETHRGHSAHHLPRLQYSGQRAGRICAAW